LRIRATQTNRKFSQLHDFLAKRQFKMKATADDFSQLEAEIDLSGSIVVGTLRLLRLAR
jgi:hypothetical protein